MLDEPFSALDSYLRWELERELLSTLREYDGTVLFVSHDGTRCIGSPTALPFIKTVPLM